MLEELFGSGADLNALQLACRALCIFIIALILIRIAGIRAFGMKSAFDNIIILLLGAILSRAVYSSSPSFLAILSAALVIVTMHRLFGFLSLYSDTFGKFIKGDKILLFKNGKEIKKNMHKSLISSKDLAEGIRISGHAGTPHDIEEAYLERNGHISVITKIKK